MGGLVTYSHGESTAEVVECYPGAGIAGVVHFWVLGRSEDWEGVGEELVDGRNGNEKRWLAERRVGV